MKSFILINTLILSTLSFAQTKLYQGDVYQAAAKESFKLELTITKDNKYLVNYPEEGCNGELKFIKEDEFGFLHFKENIIKGKEVCQDGLNVYLIYTDESKKVINFKEEQSEAEDDFFRTIGELTLKENK